MDWTGSGEFCQRQSLNHLLSSTAWEDFEAPLQFCPAHIILPDFQDTIRLYVSNLMVYHVQYFGMQLAQLHF